MLAIRWAPADQFTQACCLGPTLCIIIIIIPLDYFTSALADGFSLEFESQQVSSSFQDSSQYSVRSQKCCSWDGLLSSSNFQVLQSL